MRNFWGDLLETLGIAAVAGALICLGYLLAVIV